MTPDAVGVVGVIVPEDFLVGRPEILKAVLQPLRELVARGDILGDGFPAVASWDFISILEDFRRWHQGPCVVHVGQREGG